MSPDRTLPPPNNPLERTGFAGRSIGPFGRRGMKANKKRSDEATCFLNVDLDVSAPQDLTPFVQALGSKVFDLHTGPAGAGYQTHLELATQPESAERGIKGFVKVLSALPAPARSLWKKATQRDFNIGIQGGTEPRAFELALEPETLKSVERLGARIVVTIYAVDAKHLQKQQRRGTRS